MKRGLNSPQVQADQCAYSAFSDAPVDEHQRENKLLHSLCLIFVVLLRQLHKFTCSRWKLLRQVGNNNTNFNLTYMEFITTYSPHKD